MKVAQIAAEVNAIIGETEGLTTVVNEDLSNIVDLGKELDAAQGYENFVGKLNDHIGRMIFVDRVYQSQAPDLRKDSWEFGSILEKVDSEPGEFRENDSWQLQNGQSYDQDIFYGTQIDALYWNSATTFEYRYSRVTDQIKSAFSNASQFLRFWSMLEIKCKNKITEAMDALVMRLINALTAETLYDYSPTGDYTGAGNTRVINFLKLYNDATGESLTATKALMSTEFLKFASKTMKLALNRLRDMSVLYNVKGKRRFTPRGRLKLVMLSEFAEAANYYLQSDTWHNEFTKLPGASIVTRWQASGLAPSFVNESSIDVTTPTGHVVKTSGIVAVAFDEDAAQICNDEPRTRVHETELEEFTTIAYKQRISYYADTGENCIVFGIW